MGRDTAALGQKASGAVDLRGDEGPDIRCEWPQVLNVCPARRDGLQGWAGQRPLAAIVEVRLVSQSWH